MVRSPLIAAVAVTLVTPGLAAKEKPTRFWNLTRYTVTSFQLSPAGKNAWGPNLCAADKDGEVDHDERLSIEGVGSGHYDARLSDRTGRTCTVRNIEINPGRVFTIDEKQLTDCRK